MAGASLYGGGEEGAAGGDGGEAIGIEEIELVIAARQSANERGGESRLEREPVSQTS